MSNATQNSQSAPANKAGRSFSRFVRTSVKPVIFKLSRKLSVTYWPGRRRTISAMLLALLSGFVPGLAGAGPTGGQVVAGNATLLKPNSTTTQVNQSSQNAIINWQSFSIGAGEAVRFVQPSASAVALNRVIGADPSRIFGSLTANGKVFLVNSAGVYFAPGASVDVGGLVASSMNISNASFMSGKYKFEAGAQAGAVDNFGQLRGAFVVLAAPQVSNAGSIVTTGGTTALAAGGRVSLDIAGDKLVSLSVDAATANAAVLNSGSINADGGKVFMTASSANAVLDTVINTSGIVRAGSIALRNGQIVIDGGSAGVVKVSGTLAASGAGTGTGGGSVQVLGDKVALLAGASIDVSGDTGGGSALVGGDLHGAGAVRTASFSKVEQGAVINADALTSGNGGKVVVWSNQHTGFGGSISAKGGAQGGDGGFVETSGKHTLAFAGKVNTTAARGATGTLLLDPSDITINTAPDSGGSIVGGGSEDTYVGTAANSTLNVGTLISALGGNNVIVDTASGAAGTGNIVVDAAVSWSSVHNLTLKADGNITVNQPITATGSGAINLNGVGLITAGTMSSNSGDINIAGNAGSSSRAGSVIGTSITSTSGNVSVQSIGAITTGSIDSGTGTIKIDGNAGITIDGALTSNNTGAMAIIVNAGAGGLAGMGAGGDIAVIGGSVAVPGGGFATLYTGTVAGSTGVTSAVGAGTGRFRYNSAPGTDNYNTTTAPLAAGVNAVYRERPTVTVGTTNAGITYGDATPGFAETYSGLQNGDTSGQALSTTPTLTVGGGLSGSGHKVAGTHTVTVAGSVDQLGYQVTHVNGTLTVAKKALTSSGTTAADREYDGTISTTVDTSATTFASGGAASGDGKAYAGDIVSVDTAAVVSGSFLDKNAGIGKSVTLSGLTLQGADAANYTLTGAASATITPKVLTASAVAPDKVYDGNTSSTATVTIDSGLVGTETLGVVATGVFDSKDVASASFVTVDSITLSNGANGGLASNYSLAAGQTDGALITRRALTATATAPDKVYDGGLGATAVMNINGAGLVGTETVTGTGAGTFNSKDVLSAGLVTVNSVTLADGANGGLASNYDLGTGQTAIAHITPKSLTATATAPDKAYDGTLSSAATMTINAGLVGTETVTGTGAGMFNTKDVLSANLVTVTSVVLADGVNGGLASNYDLGVGQTATAHITPKLLTGSLTAPDKVYDGSTSATGVLGIASGLVGTETVTATGSAVFNTKDVLTANLVSVNSIVLADGANGGLASNYDLGAGPTVVAHITPKSLTATVTAPDKAYDGTLGATAVMTINAAGLVGTETVTGTGSGTFDTKDVLSANLVTVNSVALADGLNGGLASNYDLAAGQTAVAHITPKALTLTASAFDKTYDGTTAAAAVLGIGSGLVGTETVTATGSGTFNSKDVLTANLVTVNSMTLADGANGGLASNYGVAAGPTATAHITPKTLSGSATAPDKVYDGSTGATAVMNINGAGLVGTETVTGTGVGTFNTKDVLSANLVTVNAVTLADGLNGGLASNYDLATGQTATAHITPKSLTATATAPDKVYDGNVGASAVMNISGAGLVGTETVTGTGVGTFNTKDVLSANLVTVSAVTLADGINGGMASNYNLGTGQTATAHVTQKALTATAAAPDKVYDGGMLAAPVISIASGLVAGETVSATGNGTFNSKDVLGANLVTVNSVLLADGAGGGLASNYSLASGQSTTAHITPKSLSATATAADKTYDGNTVASSVLNISAGLVGTETVTGTGAATFNTKDVLSANLVTVNSVALADGLNGGLASNYDLGTGQTATAHITPKVLTLTASAFDKTYDGNTIAAAVLGIGSGLVGTETVTATGSGTFNSKDVLSANLVTVNSTSLADGTNGGMASNYTVGAGQTATAHITPKTLTATAAAPDKAYDGTLAATAVMNINGAGLVGTETVTGTGVGTFNSKDVLSANLVTVNAVTLADGLNGGLASNYALATGQSATAHVTPKSLTATATAPDKVYDGNLGASAVMNINAAGLVGTETVTGTGVGTFNSKNVLSANLVTVNAVTLADGLNGGLASNYNLGTGQTATAHVTQKALTATAAAPDKVYDGGMLAAPVMSIASGLVAGETVSATGSGTFNSKDVLSANLVTVNSVLLANGAGGGLASNYSLASGETATAHITPKSLSATAAAANKTYDGNTGASAVMNINAGLVGTETVTGTGVGAFNTKDVVTANLVTVSGVTLADGANGGLASNYSLATGQTGVAHITTKTLTASAAAADKVYDGNTVAAPLLSIASGLVGTETVSASGSGTFNNKDVVNANLVTVNAVALANGANGGLASNYNLATGQTAVAHITTKALTATATAPNKVYDGATVAAPVLSIASGLVSGETVTATGSGTFNTKDVVTANLVTVNGVTLANGAGGLASNYSLATGQSATAHITPKALSATAAVATKVYDGNTSASTAMNIAAAGLVGTETVTGIGTGVFNTKDVNTANQVTLNSVVLANGTNGGLASNYSLVAGQIGTGSITRRPSVNWLGTISTDWSNAGNWEFGAIPDLANVANVVIPVGKSVTFTSGVPALGGAVSLDGVSGDGALTINSGTLTVANALNIGSYAQAAGVVNAGSLKAASAFNESGGKLNVTGLADINQTSGGMHLGAISAGSLKVGGGANVDQLAGSALVVSGTTTVATGAGDVTLANLNDFGGKVSFISAHDVVLNDINGLEIGGNVGRNMTTTSTTLAIGATTIGGNFAATAQGAISQSGALNVSGSTTMAASTLNLGDSQNALRLKVTTGGDAVIAAAGGVAIAGDIGGKLVLTASGAVTQNAGDALHVTGTSSIDAGTNAITLNEGDNHFTSPLTLKGSTVSVVDKGALALGLGNVSGNLSVTAGGDVSQVGKLAVGGTTSIIARNHLVTLNDVTNSFGGKLTLEAMSAGISAGVPLLVDANIGASLALAAPSLTVSSANALNLHMTTGTATVNAAKALGIDGSVTGLLAVSAGGAVTENAALTVGGATSISAPGQAVTLTNAGNDFGGDLTINAGATQLADKNALSFGASAIGGNLQAAAKGDVTQKGALNVTGNTQIDTTGAIILANDANDFAGNFGGSASNVVLVDKNILTLSKLTAPTVDLRAGSELQVAPGGIVDAADIALSLSAATQKGAIGNILSSFEVRPNARIVLGSNTPAVPAYFSGTGVTLTVLNPAAKAAYEQSFQPLFLGYGQVYVSQLIVNTTSSVTSSISQILMAAQKKADSNAELIERGLPVDLTIPIPYPHEGKVKAKGPACADGSAGADGAGCDKLARAD